MREKQANQQPADVSRFLAPVGVWELKAVRKLAHLTSLTYLLHLVTVRGGRSPGAAFACGGSSTPPPPRAPLGVSRP